MLRYWPYYCDICILEDEKTCVDKAWMDDWKEVSFCRDGSVATRRQATETPALDHDTAAHIADCEGELAIAAHDDPMYDFFLLKARLYIRAGSW